jgi:hypothetical protein
MKRLALIGWLAAVLISSGAHAELREMRLKIFGMD